MTHDPLSVALRFADALDRSNWDATARLLDPQCTYHIAGAVLTGPPAIVGSYRENEDWARAHLDSIEYGSTVEPAGDAKASITFTDLIRHAGAEHLHTCRQLVEIGPTGLIHHIEHHDLPGEEEALHAFFQSVGVKR